MFGPHFKNLLTLPTFADSVTTRKSRFPPFNEKQKSKITAIAAMLDGRQCDQKKSPNVYKSCPKRISLEK